MKALLAIAAIACLSAAPVFADCPYPSGPKNVPDGNTATMDEMLATKKAVKEYDDATSAYLACIQKDHDDALAKLGDKATDKQKADLERIAADRHNAAISQLQTVADRFNEQVRIYKAKNAKPQ
jgi:hypothetical protein